MESSRLKILSDLLLNPLKNQRGYALVVAAIMLILTAGAMGFFLSEITVKDSESSAASLNHLRAHYLAESGIDLAIERLMTADPAASTDNFGDGLIDLDYENLGNDFYTIHSRGIVGDYEKELLLDIRLETNEFFPDKSFILEYKPEELPPDTVLIEDPNVVVSHIISGQPNDSLGREPYFNVGYQNPATGESRILVQFNLDVIPEGSQIDTAILILNKLPSHEQRTHEISVHPVLREWHYSYASWTWAKIGSGWTSAGGDFGIELDRKIMTSGGPQTWDVTASVADMKGGTANNYGWLLKDTNPTVRKFSRFSRPIPPRLLVIYSRPKNQLIISNSPKINGDMYAGTNIFVVDSFRVGKLPGSATTLYVPDTNQVLRYNPWTTTPDVPGMQENYQDLVALVDTMDSVANAITGFVDNKYLLWSPQSNVDLSIYQDNTVYVKNLISFTSVTVADMPKDEPGFIVTAGSIQANTSHFGDNVIVIASGDITLNNTTVGSDFRPPNPMIENLFWSTEGNITIIGNSTVYSNIIAYHRNDEDPNAGNVTLGATLYGGIFGGNTTHLSTTSAYLEGSMWTKYYNHNIIDNGQFVFTGVVPDVFAGGTRQIVISGAIRD